MSKLATTPGHLGAVPPRAAAEYPADRRLGYSVGSQSMAVRSVRRIVHSFVPCARYINTHLLVSKSAFLSAVCNVRASAATAWMKATAEAQHTAGLALA